MHRAARIFSAAWLLAFFSAPWLAAQQPGFNAFNVGPTGPSTAPPPPAKTTASTHSSTMRPDEVEAIVRDGLLLMAQGKLDAALSKANSAIHAAPQSVEAYGLRANVYSEKKQWLPAEKDYLTVLQLQPGNIIARFDLAELKFRQQQYDTARAGFLALEGDSDLGDLSKYKVFLCDLFGGHQDTAARELDAFNQAGENASYYFANIAWSLFHHQTDDARDWMNSAIHIYARNKVIAYSASLKDLGYLPLPPPH